MAVTVTDVDRAANSALSATAAADGRTDRDDRSDDGNGRHAELVLRVPPAKLDSLISTIGRLGHEDSRSVQGQDVTASQADVTARVQALTISVGRLQDFLRHSGSIADLVSLESQLTQRESDLQSTVAQQHALSDQVDLASLTVELSSAPRPAGTGDSAPAGFGTAVLHAVHGAAADTALGGGGAGLPAAVPAGAGRAGDTRDAVVAPPCRPDPAGTAGAGHRLTVADFSRSPPGPATRR